MEPGVIHDGLVAGWMEDAMDSWGYLLYRDGTLCLATTSISQYNAIPDPGHAAPTSSFTFNKTLQVDYLKDIGSNELYTFRMVPAGWLGKEGVEALIATELNRPKLSEDELKSTVIGMLQKRAGMPYESGGLRSPLMQGRESRTTSRSQSASQTRTNSS